MNILRKLTLHNLKLNKTRTLVTIIGIILSTALITVVAGIATSGQQTFLDAKLTEMGDYDLEFSGKFDENTADKLLNNRDVDSVYEMNFVGTAEFNSKSKFKPFVEVVGYSENTYENLFRCHLAEGRYPKNADELLLSPLFMLHSKKEYKIGDTIKLNIGSRWLATEEKPDSIPTIEDIKSGKVKASVIENVIDPQSSEIFIGEFEKEYKIVGILDEAKGYLEDNSSSAVRVFTAADFSATAQHVNFYDDGKFYYQNNLFVNLNDSAESNYREVLKEITGLNDKNLEIELNEYELPEGSDTKALWKEADKQLAKNLFGIEWLNVNKQVLHFKGLALNETSTQVLYGISGIILTLIIISSIFIIRNSFAISITEKTKLYGMLSSTGATPRQIKRNVLFEGFILGVIGIPLGLLLGVVVTAGLVFLCNILLKEALNGYEIILRIPLLALVFSTVLGTITIFFSTYFTARRASKIPPVVAIRNNNEIKIKSKKKKLKVPKLVNKIFGIGGTIAWKNLKRSRKKYRATIISIVVSTAVFITISSFVTDFLRYAHMYYQEVNYNLSVEGYIESGSLDKSIEAYKNASTLNEVRKSVYSVSTWYYCYELKEDNIPKNSQFQDTALWASDDYDMNDNKVIVETRIQAVEDSAYRKLVKKLGLNYEKIKDKAILYNSNTLFKNGYPYKAQRLVNSTEGLVLHLYCPYEDDEIYNEKYAKADIEIGGEFYSDDELGEWIECGLGYEGGLIVNLDWYKNNINPDGSRSRYIIDSSDPDKTEQDISNICGEGVHVDNYSRDARIMQSFALTIRIFVYGFIIVISLIGLTNIFNTITTNMRLRSKEFAMLQSVGMTNREFNRMIRLESFFYTIRALIIGIPIGVFGGWLVNYFLNKNGYVPYQFPWLAIVISIVAVMLVVWMIMRFSIGKVRKQNIIETIRNDNI